MICLQTTYWECKLKLVTFSWSHFLVQDCENYSPYISITFSHFQTFSVCYLDLPLSSALIVWGINSLHYFITESFFHFFGDMNFFMPFQSHKILVQIPGFIKIKEVNYMRNTSESIKYKKIRSFIILLTK